MPTDRLLRIVESKDTSAHFVASAKAGGRSDDAIDDRFSVLRLAGLEKGRVAPRLDEVAFGIDSKESRRLALDLAAEDERRVEREIAVLQVRSVAAFDVAHRIRDDRRDVEHRLRGPEVRRLILAPRRVVAAG